MRRHGRCVNCLEQTEIVAYGLCRACYQSEWRDRSEVRPDKYSSAERKPGRKIRKALVAMVDAFEDLDQCGALESLENKEVLRELIQQLVGQMRRVLGESLLDRLEAAGLEPAPPGVREYEAESRDDEEEEDEEDDDDNDAA